MRVLALWLGIAASLAGQGTPQAAEVLSQARARISSTMRRLPKYACIQTIERSYFVPSGGGGASSCDSTGAEKKAVRLYSTDRLRLDVVEGDGREIHSWPGAGGFDLEDVDRVVNRGPIGTGSFGGYLVDIFDNAGTEFEFVGEKAKDGREVFVYRYTVTPERSHYTIRAGNSWLTTGYTGTFEVDPHLLELERITIQTPELAPETQLCAAASTLDYQRLQIGDGDFLLPRRSELHLVRRNAQETTSSITFTDCREYQAESVVHFDAGPGLSAADAGARAKSHPRLPAGLTLNLRLIEAIDTETAAAGDAVSATVTHAVRAPKSAEVLVPEGAMAHGRITSLEHHLAPAPYFQIGIAFQSLEMHGESWRMSARMERSADAAKEWTPDLALPQQTVPAGAANSFVIPSAAKRYVMRPGTVSRWMTTKVSP